jgi:ABC-type antimicrobial peptide transport system permease subunit
MGRHVGSTFDTRGQREIVGIVSDTRYRNIRDAAPPTIFGSYLQASRLDYGWTFEIRTAGDPPRMSTAVREAIRQVDPNLAIMSVTTESDQIEQRFAAEKVFAQAYALFGSLAVVIASVGLFGLMSYTVARRTGEIGIRMALGARRLDVVRMVMHESIALVVLGVLIGTAVALAAGRFVASLLFDLVPSDPATIASAAVIMIAISALAAYLPARMAAGVDPMIALRTE